MLARARRGGPPRPDRRPLLTRASSPDRERVSHHRHETRPLDRRCRCRRRRLDESRPVRHGRACHASGARLAHGRVVRTVERSRRSRRVTTVVCISRARGRLVQRAPVCRRHLRRRRAPACKQRRRTRPLQGSRAAPPSPPIGTEERGERLFSMREAERW